MHQSILALAAQMPASAQVGQALLDAFCTAAEDTLRSRLHSGIEPETLGERFVCAAAMLACAMCAAASEGEGESLRAGNVSVSRKSGSGHKAAAALRAETFALLQDCVTDDGFAFLGVEL